MTDKLLAEWFWTDRWMGSSGFLLPMEARGVYREMLTQAWRRGARLPNDHEAIQRAIGCTAAEWARAWPKLSRFWRVDGDDLVNDTQVEVYGSARASAERASERGRRGAQATAQARAQVGAQAPLKRVLKKQPPSPSPSQTPAPAPAPAPAPENGTGSLRSPSALAGPSAVIVPEVLPVKASRQTWLTEYGNAWTERWGPESEPPWGEMAQEFARRGPKSLPAADLAERWRRFLGAAATSQWARPARFVQGLGEWAQDRPGPGARASPGRRSAEAGMRYLEHKAKQGG